MILFVTDQARACSSRHGGGSAHQRQPPSCRAAAQRPWAGPADHLQLVATCSLPPPVSAPRASHPCRSATPCTSLPAGVRGASQGAAPHLGWPRQCTAGGSLSGSPSVNSPRQPASVNRLLRPAVTCLPPACRGGEPAWPDSPEEERSVLQVRERPSGSGPAGAGWLRIGSCFVAAHPRPWATVSCQLITLARCLSLPPVLQARLHQVSSVQSSRGGRASGADGALALPAAPPGRRLACSRRALPRPMRGHAVSLTPCRPLSLPAARACAPPPAPRCGPASCPPRPACTTRLRWGCGAGREDRARA